MTRFTEQGTIDYNAGDVGGDIQATDATSRRFVRTNASGTFTVLEVYAYATQEENGAIDVQAQLWETVCTDPEDPGSSEIFADIQYDYPFDYAPRDMEQAYEWAQNFVRTFDYTLL